MKILEAKNITKMFPGVIALDSVDVAFEPGEIHAIIGENGAGKSTLIKCLTGVYEPEEGEVMIGGENAMKNKALFDKVAYVPQEIDLFGYMSVAENLFIPYEKSGVKGTVNQKELEKRAIPILEKFSIPVKPNELVKDISISSQQLLQIARATVHEDYDVLMLDEPTTSLTSRDTKILFNIVEKIKKENKAIIFISHKLEEIFQLADVITVFRNGKKVAYSEIKDVDTNWVIKQMTGRELNQNERFYSTKVSDEVLLEVNNLTGERFTNVSFKLKKGEILGFSGLVGAGRSEVMQAIFGYLPVYKGSVKLDGADWKLGDTNYSVKNGFIYLPEERKKQGILPVLSIRDNISVSVLDNLKSGISISRKKENELAKSVRHMFGETDVEENKKVKAALNHGFTTLLCIGETAEEKDFGISAEVLRTQLKIGFHDVPVSQVPNIWVAYEPVWSIGVNGTPASADYAEKMHKVIKACLREIFGDVADEIPVLYGGSVNPGNANELIVQPSIDGLFTGRAAWQADNFDKLIRDAKATYEAK